METARRQKTAPYPASPSRRGRPTAARAAVIDAAIRSAARQIFLDSGFEASSMEAVAAAARVSKGTLYARYASKDVLFHVVIEDLIGTLSLRAGREDYLLSDSLEQRLRHYARVLISVFGWNEYALATRLMHNASRSFPEIEKIWQEAGINRYVAFLANDMASAGTVSSKNSLDWTFLANLFLHGISGWYHTQLARGIVSESEATAYCDQVIEAIMATIYASGKRQI